MNIMVSKDENGKTARLTLDSALSHHGFPVLVVDGAPVDAYGPDDFLIDGATFMPVLAGDVILTWAVDPERTREERDAACLFLGQSPEFKEATKYFK